jgi:hypothetical protein
MKANPILEHIKRETRIGSTHYWANTTDPRPPKQYIGIVLWDALPSDDVYPDCVPLLDLTLQPEHIHVYHHCPKPSVYIPFADPEFFAKIQQIIGDLA